MYCFGQFLDLPSNQQSTKRNALQRGCSQEGTVELNRLIVTRSPSGSGPMTEPQHGVMQAQNMHKRDESRRRLSTAAVK